MDQKDAKIIRHYITTEEMDTEIRESIHRRKKDIDDAFCSAKSAFASINVMLTVLSVSAGIIAAVMAHPNGPDLSGLLYRFFVGLTVFSAIKLFVTFSTNAAERRFNKEMNLYTMSIAAQMVEERFENITDEDKLTLLAYVYLDEFGIDNPLRGDE